MSAREVDRNFFKEVPKPLIRDLYDKIYKIDFDMFGYEYPNDQISMGSDW